MLHNFRAPYSNEHSLRLVKTVNCYLSTQPPKQSIFISHDSRVSSRMVARQIARDCIRRSTLIGLTTTPVATWWGQASDAVCIQVTASHAPLDFVGLKITNSGYPITVTDEHTLRLLTHSNNFQAAPSGHEYECIDTLAVWRGYRNALLARLGDEGLRKLVIEVRKPWIGIFKEIFPEFVIFGRQSPDPGRLHLSPNHSGEKTALVFRFDEDADQVIVWHGVDRLAGQILLSAWIDRHRPTRAVISYDTPLTTVNDIVERDSTVEYTAVGDQFVLEKMRAYSISIGGEPNGHLVDSSWLSVPDALYASQMLESVLSAAERQYPSTTPFSRYAVSMRADMENMLSHQLACRGFIERFGMWELRTASTRCTVRISQYEPTVIVQIEGILPANSLPKSLAECHDSIDSQTVQGSM